MDSISPDHEPPDGGGQTGIDIEMTPTPSTSKRRLANADNPLPAKKTIVDRELAAASAQQVYTHPELTVLGIKSYSETDSGPYLVHVNRIESDPASGTVFKPIKFGQFLFRNKINEICQDGVKRIGRNKIAVTFKSATGANNFLNNPVLKTQNYEANIPTYNVTRMGLVRGVPVDWSMDEFVESVRIPNSSTRVIKARRMNRKIKNDGQIRWEPSQTVVLTFRGQQLPEKIFSFYFSLPVELYQFPTIQCLNCCRFGHVKAQCRSNPRCYRCAQPHVGDDCQVTENEASCLYCNSRHFSINKSCSEQDRQKAIKTTMSREGISYDQACAHFPKTRSYIEALKRPSQAPEVHPSQSVLTQDRNQTHQSYKKTIYKSLPSRTPLGKSYDKVTHQSIVADIPSSLPNGHCLSQISQSNPTNTDPQSLLLTQLLTIIINILNQSSNILPSNVAQLIAQLSSINITTNEQYNNSVEH